MCGICGILFKKNPEENLIKILNDSISHRGPNDEGYFEDGYVYLGHKRLSIIDLKNGHQPMTDYTGRYVIVYNGELYNYNDLRSRLINDYNITFKTNSDTEVLINYFSIFGLDSFSQFQGMFAVAIYDKKEKKIILFRDYFGIKPLCYYINKDFVAFSSEIQSFKKLPNFNEPICTSSIDKYLQFQFIPAPYSIFKNVYKLMPGSYLIINSDGSYSEQKKFFTPEFNINPEISFENSLKLVENSISNSVESHMVSDVEFGALLSGGVDSSLIVHYMSKHSSKKFKTFNIGFKNTNFDESKYANFIADKYKTDHYSEIVDVKLLDDLSLIINHFGEPFGDSSAIPTYYVSKVASKYVPVVLSGDGGDEFFAGYNTYIKWIRTLSGISERVDNFNVFKKLIFKSLQSIGVKKYKFNIKEPSPKLWLEIINYFNNETRKNIWNEEYYNKLVNNNDIDLLYENYKNESNINKVQGIDLNFYLPNDILNKIDISSMISSLESRTPIIDINVWKIASTIPEKYNLVRKNDNYIGKFLLKTIASKYFNNNFAFRKKTGFSIPVIDWLYNFESKKPLIYILKDKNCLIYNLFDFENVNRYIERLNPKVWLLFYLEFWLRENKNFINIE